MRITFHNMRITFHTFSMGDVEDPEIMAAQPIYAWQRTEHGNWVMQHAHDVAYDIHTDPTCYGYKVTIHGIIADAPKVTEYYLRWPRS